MVAASTGASLEGSAVGKADGYWVLGDILGLVVAVALLGLDVGVRLVGA